jgi:hypothetical protein
VERDVVLTQELHVTHLSMCFFTPPPAAPIATDWIGISPFLGGGNIADRRVEPDVEDLTFKARSRHRDAPPRSRVMHRSCNPAASQARAIAITIGGHSPAISPIVQFRVREPTDAGRDGESHATPSCPLRRGSSAGVSGQSDLRPVACLALVAAGSGVTAVRACPDHVTVRQKTVVGWRKILPDNPLLDQPRSRRRWPLRGWKREPRLMCNDPQGVPR